MFDASASAIANRHVEGESPNAFCFGGMNHAANNLVTHCLEGTESPKAFMRRYVTKPAFKLQRVLAMHAKWLADDPDGIRANLAGADLRNADLRNADLSYAYLGGAYLERANLEGADLIDAYLERANLRDANLMSAYLRGADLEGAEFLNSTLTGVIGLADNSTRHRALNLPAEFA